MMLLVLGCLFLLLSGLLDAWISQNSGSNLGSHVDLVLESRVVVRERGVEREEDGNGEREKKQTVQRPKR
jgi:hypothetical protein